MRINDTSARQYRRAFGAGSPELSPSFPHGDRSEDLQHQNLQTTAKYYTHLEVEDLRRGMMEMPPIAGAARWGTMARDTRPRPPPPPMDASGGARRATTQEHQPAEGGGGGGNDIATVHVRDPAHPFWFDPICWMCAAL